MVFIYMNALIRLSQFVSRFFALWVLLFTAIAFIWPQGFMWVGPYIPWFLGLIMFGMGATLSLGDFKHIVHHPKSVIVGVVAQFLIMPTLAYVLAVGFKLPPELAIGVILVGACPGGTASNVITYLARGNTALSVACTSVATLLAPVLTPAIVYLLASEWIAVSASAMVLSVLKMVLLPVALGVLARTLWVQKVDRAAQVLPLVSMLLIALLVAALIGGSKDKIIESGLLIFMVVVLHNGFGFLLGYALGALFKLPYADSKAIAIEVGVQNSGLGAALAVAHFSPLAAVPSAIFSLWHNISGPILATYWARKADKTTKNRQGKA